MKNKKLKVILSTIAPLASITCLGAIALTSCGQTEYLVTINAGTHGFFGTEGTTTKTVGKFSKVSAEDLTTPTADSDKYVFAGWYKTSACVDAFDFTKNLSADTTIYAGWNEVTTGVPKLKYDEDLLDVKTVEATKTVTVTPISSTNADTYEISIYGKWDQYQFNFIPSVDDQDLTIKLGYVDTEASTTYSCSIIGDSTRCPFNIQKANDGETTEMSFGEIKLLPIDGTSNFIYDGRKYGSTTTDNLKGAINCKADLTIGTKNGLGTLTINNSSNYKGFSQGIHCTKDLDIKKATTLNVCGYETAIKGNKSITVEDGAIVSATSATGDAFKTEDIDITSKGKRRGDITVIGDATKVTINATKDAFQAAHNLYIGTDSSSATATNPTIVMNTGTFNKSWSESVVTDSQDFYFRAKYSTYSTFCDPSKYTFKVYFTNSTTATDGEEVEATLKKISAGSDQGAQWSNAYAYWNCNRPFGYKYGFINLYDSTGTLKTTSSRFSSPTAEQTKDLVTLKSISESGIGTISWESKSYKEMVTGQTSERAGKTSYSSKGMKAANLFIAGGTITASVCDDFIHTKYGQLFPANEDKPETYPAEVGAGNVTITGGTITLNDCPDDGIHADGTLTIGTENGSETDLTIQLTPERDYSNNYCCYEGLEAGIINILSGTTHVYTKDDGVNASCCGNTVLTSVAINVKGGLLDISAKGRDVDGIDSNFNFNQSGGTVISRGSEGSALDIGDDSSARATITAGTLILLGKNEAEGGSKPGETSKMVYTGTTKSSISGKSKGTYVLLVGTKQITIECKYDYNSESASVYSSLGSASWQ